MLGWWGGMSWAGLFRVVEWSYRIPKQNGLQGVEWSCKAPPNLWSGAAFLGVECSQTSPNFLHVKLHGFQEILLQERGATYVMATLSW